MRGYLIGGLITICCVGSQAAPKVDEAALRSAMSENLKDSESARFKDIKVRIEDESKPNAGLWIICGLVNAKNSYGAYPGFSVFYALGVSGKANQPIRTFPLVSLGEVAVLQCARHGFE